MRTLEYYKGLDYAGLVASGLCHIHCLVLPVAVSFLPGLPVIQSEAFHALSVLLVVPLAVMALYRGFQKHGNKSVLMFGFVGSGLLVTGLLSHHAETVLTCLGGIMLMYAHLKNLKYCSCSRCIER